MNDPDTLAKAQIRSKILFVLAKQLAKHWLYIFPECKCSIWKSNNINPFGFVASVLKNDFLIRNSCTDALCEESDGVKVDKSVMDENLNCFLAEGIMNWLSYTVQQTLQSDVYDLVSAVSHCPHPDSSRVCLFNFFF
jgi:hypothetical protein